MQDFTHPDRVVMGADERAGPRDHEGSLRALYLNETPYIETEPETAEMIKYASNAFLAVKITFINEMANLCEKVGANVQDVARAMGRDGSIGAKFLHAGPGYGGSCFPKDTQAMARTGAEFGEPLSIVEATIEANERAEGAHGAQDRGRHGRSGGKTVAVLGLAFKPNTDDMREAPSIAVCEGLGGRGAKIRAWDPEAMKEAAWRLESVKDRLVFASDEYEAIARRRRPGPHDRVEPVPQPRHRKRQGTPEIAQLLRSAEHLQARGHGGQGLPLLRRGAVSRTTARRVVRFYDHQRIIALT